MDTICDFLSQTASMRLRRISTRRFPYNIEITGAFLNCGHKKSIRTANSDGVPIFDIASSWHFAVSISPVLASSIRTIGSSASGEHEKKTDVREARRAIRADGEDEMSELFANAEASLKAGERLFSVVENGDLEELWTIFSDGAQVWHNSDDKLTSVAQSIKSSRHQRGCGDFRVPGHSPRADAYGFRPAARALRQNERRPRNPRSVRLRVPGRKRAHRAYGRLSRFCRHAADPRAQARSQLASRGIT